MTKEEKVAYIQAMTVCALAEIEAMKAMNYERDSNGYAQAYDEYAFASVPEKYGITHDQISALFLEK